MQLGETIATYDVALALRGESGKFEVTSPTGETFQVTCNPNHSISNLEWSGNKAGAQPFLIRKVAEPVSLEPGKASHPSIGDAVTSQSPVTPFLLDPALGAKSPIRKNPPFPPGAEDLASAEIVGFELLYFECDPATKQPIASIRLKGAPAETLQAECSMTCLCASFNELDAEIRRLHAELDAIRSQAKKKFYKTHSIAAGA